MKNTEVKPSKLERFAGSNQIRKNEKFCGCKLRPRSHSAPDGAQLPQTFKEKWENLDLQWSSKIQLHNSTFFREKLNKW